MQWEELEDECRVFSSKEEREEGEAKFGTILGWDGVELKTQASCASPSSSSVGIILLPGFYLTDASLRLTF